MRLMGPSWFWMDQEGADRVLRAVSGLGMGRERRVPSAFPGTWASVCSLKEQGRPALGLHGLLRWGFGLYPLR